MPRPPGQGRTGRSDRQTAPGSFGLRRRAGHVLVLLPAVLPRLDLAGLGPNRIFLATAPLRPEPDLRPASAALDSCWQQCGASEALECCWGDVRTPDRGRRPTVSRGWRGAPR